MGAYTYDPVKKHQVTSAGAWSFGYDLNGNMTSGRGRTISWTSFNYPSCISTTSSCSGSAIYSQFSYTPDRQYWKQVSNYPPNGSNPTLATTIYVGGLLEKVTAGTNTDFRHLIQAGSSTIVVSRQSNGVNSVYYLNSDHLGSSVVFNGTSPTVYTIYDAFGRRRSGSWSGAPTSAEMSAIAGVTREGYTGQTMLDNLELIHMNGRVQDPVIGRFFSADPFITEPMNTQGYNRYSYVDNNPLAYIDPSGFRNEKGGPWDPKPAPPPNCGQSLQLLQLRVVHARRRLQQLRLHSISRRREHRSERAEGGE